MVVWWVMGRRGRRTMMWVVKAVKLWKFLWYKVWWLEH
jgi:hypothetical protein